MLMLRYQTKLLASVIITLVMAVCAPSFALVAPAGTNIDNVATIQYQESTSSSAQTVDSDTATVVAAAIAGPSGFVKSVLPVGTVNPGDTLSYSIQYDHDTSQALIESTILIDGLNATGVLISDDIPANTSLYKPQVVSSTPNTNDVIVQLRADMGTSNWITFAAWSGDEVSDPVASIGVLPPQTELITSTTIALQFAVRVNSNITEGTQACNTASVDFNGDLTSDASSNQVCNDLASNGVDATIQFLRPSDSVISGLSIPDHAEDSDFVSIDEYEIDNFAEYNVSHDGVYIQVDATSLNTSSNQTDSNAGIVSLELELVSLNTSDRILVTLLETSENSGVFRSVRPIILSETRSGNGATCPASGSSVNYTDFSNTTTSPDYANCVLQSLQGDTLTASISVTGVSASLSVNAFVKGLNAPQTAIVFDSVTGNPVQNAIVRVVDTTTGDTAVNVDTGLPVPLLASAADGSYSLPRLPQGDFYLEVTPPGAYLFPSAFSADSVINRTGIQVGSSSYGRDGYDTDLANRRGIQFFTPNSGVFSLANAGYNAAINIPVDPLSVTSGIAIDKQANVRDAQVGDRVRYSIRVQNISGADFNAGSGGDLQIFDTPPFGFAYESGSARLDGVSVSDPVSVGGNSLRFDLGTLANLAETELTYVLRVTSGAVDSNGINSAYATGNGIRSSTVRERVEITQQGLFSDHAFIFGKVFVDASCDGIQNKSEWPIGGVRLYMEDGTHVTTDENGQYTLYGIEPGEHVIKIDELTLPEGISALPTTTRHGADPYSRFVDLISGEYHRADFVFACPRQSEEAVLAQIQQRNQSINGEWLLDEAVKFTGDISSARREQADQNGDVSSGVIDRTAPESTYKASPQAINVDPYQKVRIPSVEYAAQQATRDEGKAGTWLWPLDDTSFNGQLMVVVRAGVKPKLWINDELVDGKLGEQAINQKQGAQVLAWYGVPFVEGDNTVKVTAVDPFGNDRVLAQRNIYYAGKPQFIRLEAESDSLSADGGRSTLAIDVRVLDQNQRPARGVQYVTLETSMGDWLESDAQESLRGHQVRVENGGARVYLRSTEKTGVANILAWDEDGDREQDRAELDINFIPVLRPMIAVGLIDISGQLSSIDDEGVQPTNQNEGFEDEFNIDGRAALFLKGKVKGDYLLTLSYDSDKDENTRLFRDIDPNAYYPIYGDASVKGYDAQSQSKLYVKLEKEKHSILWGDYRTDVNTPIRSGLANIQRTLTGINAVYDNGNTKVNVFAAEEDSFTFSTEIEGNGTATGYNLADINAPLPIVGHSERIELITRDRDNTGLVIETRLLNRFEDYTLDYFNGFLSFYEVIPSRDSNNNPVYIRVSYDSESTTEEYLIAGARVSQRVTDSIEVGGSLTHDGNDLQGFDMGSVYIDYQVSQKHNVTAEVAAIDHESQGEEDGNAARVEWHSRWSDKVDSRVVAGRAEQGFDNPSSSIREGQEELRGDVNIKLAKNTQLKAEVIHTQTVDADNARDSVEVSVTQKIDSWSVTGGVRHLQQEDIDEDGNSVRLRGERGFEWFERGGAFHIEGEQDVSIGDRRRIEVGAEYKIQEKTQLYINHERINSDGGVTGFNSQIDNSFTTLGVRSDWMPSTQLYSEYRLRGAIEGRDLEAVNGVRGQYEIEPKLTFSPSLEVIESIHGNNTQDAWALSLGLTDHRQKNLRRAVRAETRQSDTNDYYGLRASYVGRINLEWSSLILEELAYDELHQEENRLRNTLSLGFARRARLDNKWHSLYLYQLRNEKHVDEDERIAHIVSTHQNYEFKNDLTLSGRFGAKHQTQTIDGDDFDAEAYLIGSRLIWGIDRRWDIDLRLGMLSSQLETDLRYSAGMGSHYLINKNLRLGLGFNFVGFDEEDLDSSRYHAAGLFFGLQYKFDEDLFEWLR